MSYKEIFCEKSKSSSIQISLGYCFTETQPVVQKASSSSTSLLCPPNMTHKIQSVKRFSFAFLISILHEVYP